MIPTGNETVSVKYCNKYSKDFTDVWHRRLSHVNNKYIQKLIREELAIGINGEVRDINCAARCVSYCESHESVIHRQSQAILDLLYLLICVGPCLLNSKVACVIYCSL